MEGFEYKIPFINKGKPFDKFPIWTADKHEAAYDALVKNTEGWNDKKRDQEWKYYVILETACEMDSETNREELLKKLKKMHSEDLIALFNAVYTSGKKGILFRKGVKSPKK